jgi:hypothetical protein
MQPATMPDSPDITNHRFGRLTVLSRSPQKYVNRQIAWLCRCDCGNEITVRSDALRGKRPTLSCGCLQRDRVSRTYPQIAVACTTCGQIMSARRRRRNQYCPGCRQERKNERGRRFYATEHYRTYSLAYKRRNKERRGKQERFRRLLNRDCTRAHYRKMHRRHGTKIRATWAAMTILEQVMLTTETRDKWKAMPQGERLLRRRLLLERARELGIVTPSIEEKLR